MWYGTRDIEVRLWKLEDSKGIWVLPFWSSSCCSRGIPPCCHRFQGAHTDISHNTFGRRTSTASCTVCLSIYAHNEDHNLCNMHHFNLNINFISPIQQNKNKIIMIYSYLVVEDCLQWCHAVTEEIKRQH